MRTPGDAPIGSLRRTASWLALYLLLVIAPLAVLLVGERPRAGGFWWDFSLALGYAGIGMMGLQFALTARFKRATAPFGIDIIYYFHRYLAAGAYALLLFHVGIVLFRHPEAIGSIDPREAPLYMSLGWLALLGFTAILVTSLWRKPLRIGYDGWRRWHIGLAVTALLAGLWHVHGAGSYLQSLPARLLWIALGVFWIGLAVWVRLVRPWWLSRRSWRVVAVRPELERSWTLELEPCDGKAFDYHPGQFAWLTLRASPWAMREHPFSFSSSPTRPGRIAFTIKELGDFTSTIGETRVGDLAYVDGPYGSFGIDRHPDPPGRVFIAGGVGIAPLMSMLRALEDRGDRRAQWLFYGNRVASRILFKEELDAIARRIGLRIVHVLLEPPPGWEGEHGYVGREVLARHLPEDAAKLQYYVCGPAPMIRLAERSLVELGVPLNRVHSEIFDLA